MRIFRSLYDRAIAWAGHRHAPWYLGGLSIAESSFFPIPPDVMLAPMVLARRDRAWWLASLTTGCSVIGGLVGYLIGMFLFAEIGHAVIAAYDAAEAFARVKEWFDRYGVWVVIIAGFTPIPYKLFTITSGVLALAVVPFTLASIVGRGARFFLVAGLLVWGGEAFERGLRRHIDSIGWAVVALGAVGYWYYAVSG